MQIDPRLVPEIPMWSPSPEFTPEQADVLRRLEAYPHGYFNLKHHISNEDGVMLFESTDTCFRCVAGQSVGTGTRYDAGNEGRRLIQMAGPERGEAQTLMHNLVMDDYGRSVPIVRDHPPTAVPKHVAIEAVRGIFRMGNGERGV